MTGTLSQTALGTFPIFQFLDVLLKTCSLFYWLYPFILFLITIFIFSVILTLDLCRASLKTTLCDVGSLSKDLIYYCPSLMCYSSKKHSLLYCEKISISKLTQLIYYLLLIHYCLSLFTIMGEIFYFKAYSLESYSSYCLSN